MHTTTHPKEDVQKYSTFASFVNEVEMAEVDTSAALEST